MTEFPTHPGLVNQFPRKFRGFKEFDSGASGCAFGFVPQFSIHARRNHLLDASLTKNTVRSGLRSHR